MSEPKYEVWIFDTDAEYDSGEHAEDCVTLEDARKARDEWRYRQRGAWIQEKDTGKHVS